MATAAELIDSIIYQANIIRGKLPAYIESCDTADSGAELDPLDRIDQDLADILDAIDSELGA